MYVREVEKIPPFVFGLILLPAAVWMDSLMDAKGITINRDNSNDRWSSSLHLQWHLSVL